MGLMKWLGWPQKGNLCALGLEECILESQNA